MKKLIIISLIIILFISGLLILGYFYMKDTYVPKTLKALIEDSVKNNTNLQIKIENISYELLKGVIIKDLSLFQEGQEPKNGPVAIKEIRFNLMLFPSLEGKRIIIPTLYINKPSIKIERLDKQTWNIEQFLKKKEPVQKSKLPLILAKIKVQSGKISVGDNIISPGISRQFSNLNLDLNPGQLKNIVFKLSSDVTDNTTGGGRVFAKGKININKKTITAQCEAKDIELTDIWRYFNIPKTNIRSFNLKNMNTNLDYDISSQTLSFSTNAQIEDFDLDSAGFSSKGKVKFSMDSSIKSLFEKPQFSTLSANIEFSDSTIAGINFIDSLKKIKAKITIKDNYASLDEFQGLWQQDKIKATAEIPLMLIPEEIKRPQLNLDVYSEKLDAESLLAFLPQNITKSIEKISGQVKIKAHIEGLMEQFGKLENRKFSVNTNLIGWNLKLTALKNEISNIGGNIHIVEDNLEWKDINFSFNAGDFNTSGTLEDFNMPKLKFNISSPILNARSQVSLKPDWAEIESLNINSFASEVEAYGVVNFPKESQPSIDLNAKIKLETSNLKKWLPQLEQTLKQLQPEGIVNLETKVSGPILNFADWTLTLTGESEISKLAGLKISNIEIVYKQADNFINKLTLGSRLYGGQLSIRGTGKILAQALELDLNVGAKNIDIAKLKFDTALRDKKIGGIFSTDVKLNAKKPIIETLSGEGKLSIKEGNIWEIKLLKGLGEILLLPEFSRINFNEGRATFTIENKRINTEDLLLKSPQMNLAAKGWIDFDGKLDFEVFCEFSEEYIQHSADLRKLITSIFAEINKYLSVKVTGSIKDPQYKIVPKKIEIDILKPLKEILELPFELP